MKSVNFPCALCCDETKCVAGIEFNNCPTRCDCIQFITFLYAALHVSGVDTHHQELVQL